MLDIKKGREKPNRNGGKEGLLVSQFYGKTFGWDARSFVQSV